MIDKMCRTVSRLTTWETYIACTGLRRALRSVSSATSSKSGRPPSHSVVKSR